MFDGVFAARLARNRGIFQQKNPDRGEHVV